MSAALPRGDATRPLASLAQRRPLLAFVLLAYLLTWLVMLPLLLQRRGFMTLDLPEAWEALAAFGPCVAAWWVLRANAGQPWRAEWLASLRRWPHTTHGWWLTVGSPVAFLLAAVAFEVWRTGGLPPLGHAVAAALGTLHGLFELVIVAAVLQSLGEEPGWRGFLLPRLRARHRPLAATLVLFPVWLLWHLPMFLSRPEFGIAQFGGFALGILSAAIWLTAIYEDSQSTAAAVLWHTLANITRGIALAISTQAFLAYGMAVALGALCYAFALRRVRESP